MSIHHYAIRGIANFDLYPYNPSASAAWAFVVMFGLGALVHFICLFPLRAWFFIPLVLGCISEAFGYYGRALSHNNIRNGSPYLLQMMLILAAAPLIAATIYMTLGRLIRALDAEEHSPIRTRWLTKIYVVIDIGTLVCQIMGSAMQASGDPNGVQTGIHIVVGGLAFQLFAFACFVAMAAVIHRRLNDQSSHVLKSSAVRWKKHFWSLYAVSTIVFVRSGYRLLEFATGSDSVLMKQEAFLYVFDASLMFSVVVLLALMHPGRLLKSMR